MADCYSIGKECYEGNKMKPKKGAGKNLECTEKRKGQD